MIFDAYNENGRVILSVQRLVWRTLCEWEHIKGFREKIVRIIDEEAIAAGATVGGCGRWSIYTILPDFGYSIFYYNIPEWFETERFKNGQAFVERERRKRERALSPLSRKPTTQHDGRRTPPNIKYNVDVSNPYFIIL